MTDILQRDSRVIITSLKTIPEIVTELTSGAFVKIFYEDAPASIPLPYIVLNHVSGGESETRRFLLTEAIWEVTAHSAQLAEAVRLGGYIQRLHGMMPVTESSECAVESFERIMPISHRYVTQNNVLYKIGMLVRVPLMEN